MLRAPAGGFVRTNREKRTVPATVYLTPLVMAAIEQVAAAEDRSISTFLARVAQEHPTVKIVLQQISKATEGQ